MEFLGVIKKKSCRISRGHWFQTLKLLWGVTQCFGVSRGEVHSGGFSKIMSSTLSLPGTPPVCFFLEQSNVQILNNHFLFLLKFFFYQLAISLSQKINLYSLLRRPVSSSLYYLSVLGEWPDLDSHFGAKRLKGLSANYSHHE